MLVYHFHAALPCILLPCQCHTDVPLMLRCHRRTASPIILSASFILLCHYYAACCCHPSLLLPYCFVTVIWFDCCRTLPYDFAIVILLYHVYCFTTILLYHCYTTLQFSYCLMLSRCFATHAILASVRPFRHGHATLLLSYTALPLYMLLTPSTTVLLLCHSHTALPAMLTVSSTVCSCVTTALPSTVLLLCHFQVTLVVSYCFFSVIWLNHCHAVLPCMLLIHCHTALL